jgi:hypothetical protein
MNQDWLVLQQLEQEAGARAKAFTASDSVSPYRGGVVSCFFWLSRYF